jgi:hypothetical protein
MPSTDGDGWGRLRPGVGRGRVGDDDTSTSPSRGASGGVLSTGGALRAGLAIGPVKDTIHPHFAITGAGTAAALLASDNL